MIVIASSLIIVVITVVRPPRPGCARPRRRSGCQEKHSQNGGRQQDEHQPPILSARVITHGTTYGTGPSGCSETHCLLLFRAGKVKPISCFGLGAFGDGVVRGWGGRGAGVLNFCSGENSRSCMAGRLHRGGAMRRTLSLLKPLGAFRQGRRESLSSLLILLVTHYCYYHGSYDYDS